MKCPVCKTKCGETEKCPTCGFDQLRVEFINIEEAENWEKNVFKCQNKWKSNKQKPQYIYFGKYYINNIFEKEPLKWRILYEDNEKCLIITQKLIDYKKYHNTDDYITWKNSNIREWLNTTFIDSCFTTDEKERIIITPLVTESLDMSSAQEVDNTLDKVFLLSVAEAKKYFSSSAKRQSKVTPFAYKKSDKNIELFDIYSRQSWWLRNEGNGHFRACSIASVWDTGGIFEEGFIANSENAIRPAMWIKK